ncbi:MAG: hypothetical protein EZS28_032326 [Streblomastix strix]|uniref:Uncharacterized protein n=1 Tax=Streblomastix strix TaxID=222440 RepID=A0A5J4UNY5_9EUKA|nr:MAG: hypothetical protein EZS28_032326 [Streblomastix strix]
MAILITPDWRTLPCGMNLESKSVMSIKLPPTGECCIAGPGMEVAEATLPLATRELILSSDAQGTLSHYLSSLKHWISWCNVKEINPISNDPIDLANCMYDQFSSVKRNRCMCESMRSAVSSINGLITGKRLGQDYITQTVAREIGAHSDDGIRNLIKKFMKYAGLDVSLFSAYSLKAAGLSEA